MRRSDTRFVKFLSRVVHQPIEVPANVSGLRRCSSQCDGAVEIGAGFNGTTELQ